MADECVPIRVVRSLGDAFKSMRVNVEIHHLPEYLDANGVPDPDWVAHIASLPSRWVVLTGDTGQADRELPDLLRCYRVPAVFLSRNMQRAPEWTKYVVVVGCWMAFHHVAKSKIGDRYKVFLDEKNQARFHPWHVPREPNAVPPEDGYLVRV